MSRLHSVLACLALAGGLALADAAYAGVCSGPLPKPGEVIEGPVLHVEDGRTLCVAEGFEPDKWVPIQVADAAGAGTPRSALMAAAFGKDVVCKVQAVANGTAVASCTIEQRPLAALLQKPGVLKATGEWR